MRNSVHGVRGGVWRTMRARMYLHADSIATINFTWVRDVVAHGAGHVERSTVLHITTLFQGRASRPRRTITIRFAVRRRGDSNRRSIVVVAIQDIVGDGGKYWTFVEQCVEEAVFIRNLHTRQAVALGVGSGQCGRSGWRGRVAQCAADSSQARWGIYCRRAPFF